MKLRELIAEVKMSPNALDRMSSNVNAIAGIEFEMYVPADDTSTTFKVSSFSDVENFFKTNYVMDDEQLEKILHDPVKLYKKWLLSIGNNAFKEHMMSKDFSEEIEEYIRDTYYDQSDDEVEQLIKDALSDPDNEDAIMAIEQYEADYRSDLIRDFVNTRYDKYQPKWFQHKDIGMASDFLEEFKIPTTVHIGIESIAEEFKSVVDSPVKFDYTPHNIKRDGKSYVIEPDLSLDERESRMDFGLEFISPPLPLSKMISDMNNIIAWAKSNNCYTNHTCGLHMNVSIDGVDNSNLDYIKLAVFVGEDYLLNQFGRDAKSYANHTLASYTKKVMTDVNKMFKGNPLQVIKSLDTMKSHLSNIAKHKITNHRHGLHVRDNYVEFRYAGNDWLNMDFQQLVNTLKRYVVAYSIACDPNAYRQEYASKLTKMLGPSSDTDAFPFIRYATGVIPQEDLINNIKHVQKLRAMKRDNYKNYIVSLNDESSEKFSYMFDVFKDDKIIYAKDPAHAIQLAKQKWGPRYNNLPDSDFNVVVEQ